MHRLHLKYQSAVRQLLVPLNISSTDLNKLFEETFKISGQVIGITDKTAKFYDLSYVSKHLSSLKNQVFDLIVAKDVIDENLSFGKYINYLASEYYEKPGKNDCDNLAIQKHSRK